MQLCDCCKIKRANNEINSIVSYDSFSNMILTYICDNCLIDKNNFDYLLDNIDQQLNSMKNINKCA